MAELEKAEPLRGDGRCRDAKIDSFLSYRCQMRWNVWVYVIGDRDSLLQLNQHRFEQVDAISRPTVPSSATIMKGSAGFTPHELGLAAHMGSAEGGHETCSKHPFHRVSWHPCSLKSLSLHIYPITIASRSKQTTLFQKTVPDLSHSLLMQGCNHVCNQTKDE